MRVPALVAILAVGLCAAAQAQNFPNQPIKFLVPFTPGTGMDIIARTVGPKLTERLGQPVVVQNQPGASGNIGADAVAKSSPDGYTVMVGANTMLMAAQLYRNVPFDPLKDFAPVSLSAWGTLMLVSSNKSGIRSLGELVAQAKARPGQINYGSPGVGTPHHMAMELFRTHAGINLQHVPFKASAGYTQDLLTGEINVGFLPIHVAQGLVAGGKLNALAVGSPKRHPATPSVPTIEELGHKGVEVDMWYAFFVPSKTPAPVVNRLQSEIRSILAQPDVKEIFAKVGLDAAASTPEELGQLMQRDYPRWGNIIRQNNIAAE